MKPIAIARETLAVMMIINCICAHAELPASHAVPGGIAVLPIYSSEHPRPTVTFGRNNIRIVDAGGYWWALTGIPLNTIPGDYVVSVSMLEEPPQALEFRVAPHTYPTVSTGDLPRSRFSGLRSILERRKNPDVAAAASPPDTWQTDVFSNLPLAWPAEGSWENRFGYTEFSKSSDSSRQYQAVINGTNNQLIISPGRALCTDIRLENDPASETPADSYSITLDHGGGLISRLNGVSDPTIQVGDEVQQGAMIGRLKNSRENLDPTLHWRVRLNGVFVNPAQLTEAAQHSVPSMEPVSFPWAPMEEEAPAPDTM